MRETYTALSNQDTKYLARATELARQSTLRQKHGAIIVRSGSVIGVGINSRRNHPSIVTNPGRDSDIHAEVAAIRASGNVEGAVLYVARVSRGGNTALSRPCDACYLRLTRAGIKRVVYTDNTTPLRFDQTGVQEVWNLEAIKI